MDNIQRVGEVIEARTTAFTAQCYELYQLPPLGSLVKTKDSSVELYGVVCGATTTSLEPGRRPIARGKDEVSEEELYRSNPQLYQLLKSEFSALVIGYREDGKIHHYLPPQPARIHGFVHLCQANEIKEISQSYRFLNILVNTPLPIPTDELIAACLRQMSHAYQESHPFLVNAGKELSLLLSGQLNKLTAILERIKK